MIPVTIGKEQFFITSDEMQWKYGRVIGRDKKGNDVWDWQGYFSTLPALMTSLCEKKLRTSDYNSFQDLIRNVSVVRDELTAIYSTEIAKEGA